MNITITRLTSIICSLTILYFETGEQTTLAVDRLFDVPAVRGQFVAFWHHSDEGTLTVVDVKTNMTAKLTKVPYLGRILIHPKLDVIIAFGHIPDASSHRHLGRAGNLAKISMYDFSRGRSLKKMDPAKHDRIFQALSCDWYRDGILQYVQLKRFSSPSCEINTSLKSWLWNKDRLARIRLSSIFGWLSLLCDFRGSANDFMRHVYSKPEILSFIVLTR